jgi:hypothetical protein
MATTFGDKVSILSEIFSMEEPTPQWQEFIQFCNLGLPYAYGVQRKFFPAGEDVTRLINKTFDVLLEVLELEDHNYNSLEEMTAN